MNVFSYSRAFSIPSAQVHGAEQNIAKFVQEGVQLSDVGSTGNARLGFSNFQFTLKGETEAVAQSFRAIAERLALVAR